MVKLNVGQRVNDWHFKMVKKIV